MVLSSDNIRMISDPSVSETGAALEDVRSTLFSELKERGLLSSVKAQLRGKVVQELQSLAKDRPVSVESSTQRWGRVCFSVLAEYLQITGLEYTLSVLLIEGGCGKEGVMGRGEVKQNTSYIMSTGSGSPGSKRSGCIRTGSSHVLSTKVQ